MLTDFEWYWEKQGLIKDPKRIEPEDSDIERLNRSLLREYELDELKDRYDEWYYDYDDYNDYDLVQSGHSKINESDCEQFLISREIFNGESDSRNTASVGKALSKIKGFNEEDIPLWDGEDEENQ